MSDQQELPMTVLIVGAGWVGRQIALRMAVFGISVDLYDVEESVLRQAQLWMQENRPAYLESKRAWSSCSVPEQAVRFIKSLDLVASPPQFVLECVTEQISIKKRVLRELAQRFPAPTIIASNSSYFTPSMLCKYVQDDSRFGHLHFHAPLYRSTLADVVGGPGTSPTVVDRLSHLATSIGQKAMVLCREHPGYVVNWLLQSLLRSALELAEKGVSKPNEIDEAWKIVSGMEIGPFELMDEIGLDLIHQSVSNARWAEKPSDANDRLLAYLNQLLQHGRLGRKNGKGFYEYESKQNS